MKTFERRGIQNPFKGKKQGNSLITNQQGNLINRIKYKGKGQYFMNLKQYKYLSGEVSVHILQKRLPNAEGHDLLSLRQD